MIYHTGKWPYRCEVSFFQSVWRWKWRMIFIWGIIAWLGIINLVLQATLVTKLYTLPLWQNRRWRLQIIISWNNCSRTVYHSDNRVTPRSHLHVETWPTSRAIAVNSRFQWKTPSRGILVRFTQLLEDFYEQNAEPYLEREILLNHDCGKFNSTF